MRLSKAQLAILAVIGANIIWGASPPIFKWSLETIPPFTFIFIRFFLSTLMLLPFVMHRMTVKRGDIPKFFLLAFVGFTLSLSSTFVGLTIGSSINFSIIQSSAPVFLLLASIFMLKEKTKKKVIFGTILSLLGVILIIAQPIFEHGLDGSVIGNLLFVMSMLTFVVYALLLKEWNFHYPAKVITFWIFAFATILFFPLFVLENHLRPLNIPSQGLIGILFAAIFTGIIGYTLFNYAIKHIEASELGIYLYIDPIVTVMVAIPLLGEKITLAFITGSLLVFAGIFIAEGRLHYHPLHKLKPG